MLPYVYNHIVRAIQVNRPVQWTRVMCMLFTQDSLQYVAHVAEHKVVDTK